MARPQSLFAEFTSADHEAVGEPFRVVSGPEPRAFVESGGVKSVRLLLSASRRRSNRYCVLQRVFRSVSTDGYGGFASGWVWFQTLALRFTYINDYRTLEFLRHPQFGVFKSAEVCSAKWHAV